MPCAQAVQEITAGKFPSPQQEVEFLRPPLSLASLSVVPHDGSIFEGPLDLGRWTRV